MGPFIFWFNCPFCGAHPRPQTIADYLVQWKKSPESDFDALLCSYQQILLAIRGGHGSWLTKKSLAAANSLASWFDAESAPLPPNRIENGELVALSDCPVCGAVTGPRPKDRYFTEWGGACRVQVANLLYEAGIIIFSVVQVLPKWASPERMGRIGDLLFLNQKAMLAISLLECPFCGRKTTCLYGDGTADNPYRCRWCLDASGCACALLSLAVEADGSIALRVAEPSLPAKVSGTIVPWSIMARIKRRQRRGG